MKTGKQVLQGIDNFKEIIDSNGYYIDKTLLAKDIIDRPDKIILITRPRRFGKTLNMSMLKYFFELAECREHELEDKDLSYLFEDLLIFEDAKYRNIQGTYPLIYLTFKNAKQDNWESTYENIKEIISNEYKRHSYILDKDILSNAEKQRYNKIMELEGSQVDYTNVIINLSEYLKRYFKKDCMVIIDEYDTPIQAGYINGYFEKVIEFKKSMLVKGFKDNKALKQGVLTGIMKVAQESIFSDFNNPVVSTVLSEEFKDRFGFNQEEVEKMAKYFNLEDKLKDIKAWYNGYIFGLDSVIYNPWSIIKYMYNPKNGLKPYWINTSDNRIIKEVMQLDKKEGKEVVEKLLKGEEVRKVLEENVVYQSIKHNPNVAWSFLLHTGYLKASDRQKDGFEEKFNYKLEIPNVEIKTIYKDMILDYFKEDAGTSEDIENIIESLFNNDIAKFERLLRELYLSQVSYHDIHLKTENLDDISETKQDYRYENFHHGFMLGMLMLALNKYNVFSNREYGLGRPDIVLIPKDETKPSFVFEFKWESTKGPKSLEDLARDSINQISNKKYIEGIRLVHKVENILCMGIGFKGKELKIIRK